MNEPGNEVPNGVNFKLLSWNIDGLDGEDLVERTEAVVALILSRNPDVVLLQEVVAETLQVFRNTCAGYTVLVGELDLDDYFNAILVRSSSVNTENSALECLEFVESMQGRHFLVYPVKFAGADVTLMTSHLESCRNNSDERKRQFRDILLYMRRRRNGVNVIFGGDTNLRDREVVAVGGLPQEIVDAWVSCGSPQDANFTWDLGENDNKSFPDGGNPRLRFDRIFLRSAQNGKVVRPSTFTLVGKERLSCGRFASDHWGIWMEFTIE